MAEKLNLLQLSGDKKIHIVNFMRIWANYDKNQNGYLEEHEVDSFVKDWLKAQGSPICAQRIKAEKELLYQQYDVNKDNRLELNEVARILPIEENFLSKYPGREKLSRDDFNTIFAHYDQDNSGRIGGNELLGLLKDLFARNNQAMQKGDLDNYAQALLEIYNSQDGKLSRDDIGVVVATSL